MTPISITTRYPKKSLRTILWFPSIMRWSMASKIFPINFNATLNFTCKCMCKNRSYLVVYDMFSILKLFISHLEFGDIILLQVGNVESSPWNGLWWAPSFHQPLSQFFINVRSCTEKIIPSELSKSSTFLWWGPS